jgi:REP element-mobilizing transposase RayT
LADSLPQAVVEELTQQRAERDGRLSIEQDLDAGYGACHLRDPRIATLVQNAFLYFDGQRYRLLAWVIMPNHMHVAIEVFAGHPLDRVLYSWKSFTARQANAILGRRGRFWSVEYFDRMVRSEEHYAHLIRYVHENPVKAGLVAKAEDWSFGSAARQRAREVDRI